MSALVVELECIRRNVRAILQRAGILGIIKRYLTGRDRLTVQIFGRTAPVIGPVGMNHTIVDVTGINCYKGDPVTINASPIFVKLPIVYR